MVSCHKARWSLKNEKILFVPWHQLVSYHVLFYVVRLLPYEWQLMLTKDDSRGKKEEGVPADHQQQQDSVLIAYIMLLIV